MHQYELFGAAVARRRREPSKGELLKQVGQQRAADRAGSAWVELALAHLRKFCRHRSSPFRWEEFRAAATADGLPDSPSHKVWGALPQMATREGIVRFTGRFEAARSPATHGHPVRVYEACR